MFLLGFRSSLAMLWPCSARYWMNSSCRGGEGWLAALLLDEGEV